MKNKTVFFCKECGHESSKWMGKCPACNSWNSFVEEIVSKSKSTSKSFLKKSEVKNLKDIEINEEIRLSTGFKELNKVFGNGIVKGSISLIGGEPGIR